MTDGPFGIPTKGPGRLATMAAPSGEAQLEAGLRELHASGVTTLVSLLSADEETRAGLAREATTCAGLGLRFRSHPLPDLGLPDDQDAFWELARELHLNLQAGESIVVHCLAGIGRSSLLAAAILTQAGCKPTDALALIATARGRSVPDTDEQRAWFLDAAARRGPC